ncbi:MAG: response regulator [Cyclobacteriaceae bacterium]
MKPVSFRIFVVDDDPFYQELVTSYLHDLGHSTRSFTTGEEFLKHLDSEPDLVILDHNLESDLRGDDVLRQIKSQQHQIPVIYISSEESVSVVSDAYRLGSMDFIGKDSASLVRIKLALEKIERERALVFVKMTKRIMAFCVAVAVVLVAGLLYYLQG